MFKSKNKKNNNHHLHIFNDYSYLSSVSNMLSKLDLHSLQKRRQIISLTMFYKIKHNLVNIQFPSNIHPSLRSRYTIPRSRINAHMYSFFPRTAKLWNNLPPVIALTSDHSEQGFSKLFNPDSPISSISFSSLPHPH